MGRQARQRAFRSAGTLRRCLSRLVERTLGKTKAEKEIEMEGKCGREVRWKMEDRAGEASKQPNRKVGECNRGGE